MRKDRVEFSFEPIAVGLILLFAGMSAQAGTNVWTGAASSDWNEASNWEPRQVPAATDVAKFTKVATVTPPATFAGVVWVSEAAVTLNANDAAEFSLRLGAKSDSKSSVTKTGSGKLTIHPYRGMNFGTITVSAGEVDFAGNGEEAPGAFDKLVVATDAKVRVVDSPIATRHGAVQHGGYVSTKAKPDGYNNDYYTYFSTADSAFADQLWDTWFCCTTRVSRVYVPQGPDHPLLYKNLGTPDVLLASRAPTAIFHRAIVLSESSTSGLLTILSGDNNSGVMTSVFRDGISFWNASWKSAYSKSVSTPLGWHELKTIHWSEAQNYGWKVSWQAFSRDPLVLGDSGLITEDVLWLGICFNAIDLKTGGEIAIADGQALGVALAENLSLAGVVTSESDNAYFSVMASYRSQAVLLAGATVLNGLDGFTGTLEVGRSAWVRLPAAAKDATYAIEGKGEVLAATGTEGRFSSVFTGTINVPAGETFTLAEGQTNPVTGEGVVTLAKSTTAAQLAGFLGERRLCEAGAYSVVDELGREAGGKLLLANGKTYEVERLDLLNHGTVREAMPGVGDTAAWTYRGTSTIDRIIAPDGTAFPVDTTKLPYCEVGNLVLADACDMSRRGVFLTGMPLKKEDEWSCEFDVHSYLPTPSPYKGQHGWVSDYRAGYFCFFLCDGGPGEKYESSRPWQAWKGTCGFTHAYWDKGSIGTAYDGYVEAGGLTGAHVGIDLARPYHMKVVGRFGQITATLSQDGHEYVRSIDASDSFASGTATIGLCASSDYWNDKNTGLPWIRVEVSNFTGSRVKKTASAAFSTGDAEDSGRAMSSANWTVADSSSISGTTLTLCPSTAGGYAYGQAVCNTPISPRQAFEVEYDITYSKSAGGGTATLQAILLQTEGTKPVRQKSGNGCGAYYLKNTTSYGFVTQSYGNYGNWVSGLGDAAETQERHSDNTLKITANKANHVRLTYDGAGTLHIVYSSDEGKTDDSSYTFRKLANETKDLYLMFSLGTTWAACGEVKIANFKFTPRTVTHQVAPLSVALAVEAGGSATLKLPDLASDGLVPTLSNVALVGGTALTIAPTEQQTTAKINVSATCAEGAEATLTAAEGANLIFGSFAFAGAEPSLLKLTGAGTVAFDDPLAFTIPAAWKSIRSAKLVDYADIVRTGDIPAERPLSDETGAAFRNASVSAGETSFTYMKHGMILFVR